MWLVRDGEVLAACEIAQTRRERSRGLLGRDGVEGALVLRPCRQVHSVGMRFAIDVAFLDAEGVVIHISTLKPWRISRLVVRSRGVVEAQDPAFSRWHLAVGDRLELRG